MQNYDQPLELRDYWGILRRRKLHFLLPFVLVLAGAAATAWLLPSIYRSEATILIQRQSIPTTLVATTVTGYVQEQIQQILQRITTHENMLQIASSYGLYPDLVVSDPQRAARRVRENIEVQMRDVQASNPDQSGTRIATIAFTVAYKAENPNTARAVTREISQRFLEVHRLARSSQAAQVSAFLTREAEVIRAEIAEYERQLASFRQGELRQLPELMSMNLQLHERTDQQIQQTEERIRSLHERIEATRAELSLTPAYRDVVTEQGDRILTASERLSALTASYLQASARYAPNHPDIVRLRREIRILAEQTGNAARADELMNRLVNVQEQLRQARQQYADSHPEVQRLEAAVAAVQRGFQTTMIATNRGNNVDLQTPPDNPRYVGLRTQLESAELNLAAEEQRLVNLREKLDQYEERLYRTPVVERDFSSLSRGYNDALRKFSELNLKQREARLAETLEAGQGAEQWHIVSAAFLPTLPESPNRIGILLLGSLFAFAAAIGIVAVAEYLDKTVRSPRALARVLGAPPLAVIPSIPEPQRRKAARLSNAGAR